MNWLVIGFDYNPPSDPAPPAASLIATFDASVVIGGSFGLRNVQGNSNGNAFGTLFSFSVPAGGSGGPAGYIPVTTSSLSGTLTSNAMPFDISMFITADPFGAGVVIATLPANTTSATISWSGGSSPGFTAAQLRELVRKRRRS